MSLLSVTVKKARYVGIQATQFNTYVTLKLQNVKSTTVTVKGPTPCWEQDFLFEINDINLGLLVEVWNKGVIWDRALGYHYLPLTSVAYDEQECGGRWVELEAQLMMRGGAVVGTTGPTGHALLLDCRFEPPFDAEGTGGADLQRKLDLLNGALDAERAEQARRQLQYVAHSGYSEDSDYTSDLNYPVGQHANCSASQFRSAAHQMHTPQRSLEASRENSYEREEYHLHGDTDPLYYNSQPRTNRIETWSQLHAQASVESAISWRTATDWQSGEEQRRPSLERQNTLYDDSIGYGYESYTTSTHIRDHSHLSQQPSYEEYYDSSSYPCPYEPWAGRYFFEESLGLTPTEYENIVNKRRSSVVQLPQMPPKQLPPSSRYSDYNEMAPYRPRPRRTAASLPATPSSTPKRGRALPVPPGSETGWGRRGRRLPRPPPVTATTRLPSAQPTAHTHVPYTKEPERTVPDVSFGYDTYKIQPQVQDTVTEQYQDTNYNTNYDEDGMQPFFDETPHATPPAATAQKTTWAETESTTQFSYPVTSEVESVIPKSVPSKISSYIHPPVTTKQDIYSEQSYQYDSKYDNKQEISKFHQQDQIYQDEALTNQYLGQKTDLGYEYQIDQDYQDQFKPKPEYTDIEREYKKQQELVQMEQTYFEDLHQFQQSRMQQDRLHQRNEVLQKDRIQQQGHLFQKDRINQQDQIYQKDRVHQIEQVQQDRLSQKDQVYQQDRAYQQDRVYQEGKQFQPDQNYQLDQQYQQDQKYQSIHQYQDRPYYQDQKYQQDQTYQQEQQQYHQETPFVQDQQYQKLPDQQQQQFTQQQEYQKQHEQELYIKQQQELVPNQQQQQYLQDQQLLQQQQQQQQQQVIQYQQRQLQQQQQQQQQQLQQNQQQQQQQQKPPAQQLQSTVLTGAATLGSFMAGGAKKLGSFFGAAAAAVATPAPSQQQQQQLQQQQHQQQLQQQQQLQLQQQQQFSAPITSGQAIQLPSITTSVTKTPLTISSDIYTTSVLEDTSIVPTSTVTTTAPSLPRTPSLKRQESMQRPSVRRTRTLPDAPEDLSQGSFDESAYEDEYNKTELDQVDRTSLDRYRDDDFVHDTIHEDVVEEAKAIDETSIQKTASPTKILTQVRKPSVDSYHSQAPSILDRKTSQSSFISQHEEKLTIPTTLEEQVIDKSKVTFHEVPDEQDRFERQESFDQDTEYQDDQDQYPDETFREDEKFTDQERFNEIDDQYPEDSVFNEDQERQDEEQMDFQPEQPKLTPKQRWHRAYNKIVMQLNVSYFYSQTNKTD